MTTTVLPFKDPPDPDVVDEACRALEAGFPIAIPTDTVYRLAADPFVPGAVRRVFGAKRRPGEVVMPVLVADLDQARPLAAVVPEVAERLMHRFWPGPLTVVLPRRPDLGADLGDTTATIGLRCPAHPAVQLLCRRAGPLATTSANLHGQPPLTTAAAVAEAFAGSIPLVLDGGPCVGAPSTVVDCTAEEPALLREGRLPWPEIVAATR